MLGVGEKRLPFTVRQLIEMDGCARCELCKDACSVLNLTKVNPHPLNYPISFAALLREFRSLIKRQYGLLSKLLRLSPKPEKIWECAEGAFLRCTLCGRCMVLCPLGINTHSMIVSMRRYFVEKVDVVPETVRKVMSAHDLPHGFR
ncbi:TPA: (Fe-S)-binding protein, partial [Candidatus Micrarchaeota archaeon]|nr:(Fe-S)-binding protein [Candidatus Micrarchaeota archaeon]